MKLCVKSKKRGEKSPRLSLASSQNQRESVRVQAQARDVAQRRAFTPARDEHIAPARERSPLTTNMPGFIRRARAPRCARGSGFAVGHSGEPPAPSLQTTPGTTAAETA